jgi:hypothetical protein
MDFAWQDCRRYPNRDACAGSMDIYVQRVTKSGNVLWAIDGTPLTKELGNQGIAPGTPLESIIAGVNDSCGGRHSFGLMGERPFAFHFIVIAIVMSLLNGCF